MTGPLHLADYETAEDLATFVSRARTLEDDGAIRLQADGATLATWVGVRKGRGLMGEGTVVGLRVLRLAEPVDHPLDTVVPLRAVSDRLARRRNADTRLLEVPPTTVRTTWAAVTPPRAGWSPLARLPLADLVQVARNGIAQVAEGTPQGAGAAAVEQLREKVWNRPIAGDLGGADGLPAGAALGIYALGFAIGSEAHVFGTARWHRVSTSVGHVLVR